VFFPPPGPFRLIQSFVVCPTPPPLNQTHHLRPSIFIHGFVCPLSPTFFPLVSCVISYSACLLLFFSLVSSPPYLCHSEWHFDFHNDIVDSVTTPPQHQLSLPSIRPILNLLFFLFLPFKSFRPVLLAKLFIYFLLLLLHMPPSPSSCTQFQAPASGPPPFSSSRTSLSLLPFVSFCWPRHHSPTDLSQYSSRPFLLRFCPGVNTPSPSLSHFSFVCSHCCCPTRN